MVLRYTGDCSEFCGSVLRLRKGFTNEEARRQIEEDFHFQRLVLQPILAPQRLGKLFRTTLTFFYPQNPPERKSFWSLKGRKDSKGPFPRRAVT